MSPNYKAYPKKGVKCQKSNKCFHFESGSDVEK